LAVEPGRWQIEREEVLAEDLAAGGAAGHLHEPGAAVEPDHFVAEHAERGEVAAGAAAEIEQSERRRALDRGEQCVAVLCDVVVGSPGLERLRGPLVVGEGPGGDRGQGGVHLAEYNGTTRHTTISEVSRPTWQATDRGARPFRRRRGRSPEAQAAASTTEKTATPVDESMVGRDANDDGDRGLDAGAWAAGARRLVRKPLDVFDEIGVRTAQA